MRVAFLMEQHIGHRTFYLNLRRHISIDPRLDSRWVEISYYQDNGGIEKSPIIPASLKGDLRGFLQTRQGLKKFPADVVFVNTHVPATFILDHLQDQPTILCTDITPIQYDSMAQEYNRHSDWPTLFKGVKHRLHCAVFQKAAHIIAWSSWVRRSLIQDYGVAADKITVIPPGVDLESWQPNPLRPAIPTRPLKILFVGGDFARKGGNVLLEAFKLLEPGAYELHLVTREPIRHFTGMHIYHSMVANGAELVRLYRECDLFVLPTLAEAFGIVALEAMASGLPVIASRIGGLGDIIEEQRNGLFVPPGDPQALAAAISRLGSDYTAMAEMRISARQTTVERFNSAANANQCISLILQMAGKPRG